MGLVCAFGLQVIGCNRASERPSTKFIASNGCDTTAAAGQAAYLNGADCPAPRDEVSILLISRSASTMPRSLARRYHNNAWA